LVDLVQISCIVDYIKTKHGPYIRRLNKKRSRIPKGKSKMEIPEN